VTSDWWIERSAARWVVVLLRIPSSPAVRPIHQFVPPHFQQANHFQSTPT
jgi:hypothetical protein